ncbi:hypothetical protein [Nocardioides campestrisoli]|uniref:hypothetical protein n=1 Tax=Nocardioides campestrisoli TaxID=2736757 RepID=UPI0015E69A42|nr:hypothetical protein [Nocardioides campestrisoli]
MNRLTSLLVAGLLGTLAVLVVDSRLDASADLGEGAGDRVLAAVEGLRDDSVHVDAASRTMLDEEGEQAIAEALAERDLPVYVLVWQDSWFAGYDHYLQAAEQVLAHLDEPAALVLWQGPDHSTTQVTEGYRLTEYEPDYLGDPALRIPEWFAQLPEEPLERLGDEYGGPVGGFFLGLFLGLAVLLVVWVLIGIVRLATGRRFRNLPART